MDFQAVMGELEALGTAQNRKVYPRHGVQEPLFGVSFANLGKLHKKIRQDHALALELWASGNHDARVLATMVADASALGLRELDGWCREIDNYIVADAFSKLVARGPHRRRKVDTWTRSPREFVGQTGYNLLASLALDDGEEIEDAYFVAHLERIEEHIHDRANRIRHAMNQALISIGVRTPPLTTKALAAAGRIGKVDVEHGDTSCKTPDAADYIRRTLEHRQKKAE
ncbi:MAG: DNA alkylation repair protein [Acidobacteriota bacterium]